MGTAAGLFGSAGTLHTSGVRSLMVSALEGLRLHARKSSPCVAVDGESAKKFAPRAHNTPNSAFLRVPGEFFRGRAAGGAVLGEFFRAKRPCAGLGGDAAHFGLAAMGVLHYMTPFCGVSPACRTLVSCNSPDWWHEAYISAAEPSLGWRHSPRLVAMTPRLEAVWCPNRRPPQ